MKRGLMTLLLALALFFGGVVLSEPARAEGIGVYRPEPEMHFLVGRDRYKVKRLTRGLDKTGLISLVEVTVPGGSGDGLMGRMHSVGKDLTIYIEEGTFAFKKLEDRAIITLTNGELLQIGANMVYSLKNNRDVAGKLLIVSPDVDWTAFLGTVGAKARNLKSLATVAPEIKPDALERSARKFGLNFSGVAPVSPKPVVKPALEEPAKQPEAPDAMPEAEAQPGI
jgi:quercetin dioxygenase-like cupin family protein